MPSTKSTRASSKLEVKTESAALLNLNFRARIIYKSSAVQDFLVVAISTNIFEVMRQQFTSYLSGGTPKSGTYSTGTGVIAILWSEVASFHNWTD
jgi:hypothetical protein